MGKKLGGKSEVILCNGNTTKNEMIGFRGGGGKVGGGQIKYKKNKK